MFSLKYTKICNTLSIAMKNEEIKNTNSSDVDYSKATPMFRQFLDIKKKYGNIVLLFRLGDFYEGFFEDAILFSKELGLTLTHKNGGDIGKVPMAGIPVKSIIKLLYVSKWKTPKKQTI